MKRACQETNLAKKTISKIYNAARFAIHRQEITARVFHPICEDSILERENNYIWQRLAQGENQGNRREFYNSPACEMDESLMTHINGEQVWVVGAWDRAARRAIVEVVGNDRSGEVLARFVQTYIRTVPNNNQPLARTRIYHDGWRGYLFLEEPNSLYESFTIIHEGRNFGHDIYSTNRIEGFWSDLRREARFARGRHFQNIRDVILVSNIRQQLKIFFSRCGHYLTVIVRQFWKGI